jgi:hypothetical protein
VLPATEFFTALSTTDHITGQPLSLPALLRGPDGAAWEAASAEEYRRLLTQYECMEFVHTSLLPANYVPTYFQQVAAQKEKPEGLVRRVRGTVGGNKVVYTGAVSAQTASLPTIKVLLNAVVSDPTAKFMTADISNFYLHSDLPSPEFMWIQLAQIPASIQAEYDVAQFADTKSKRVLVRITKGIYGLPQAGLLAQQRLFKILAQHGYHPTEHTPALFRHETRPVAFSLIVDDFGVKYRDRADAEHLLAALRTEYAITVDWEGAKYVGLRLKWDYDARTVDLSMPDYVRKAIARFGLESPFQPAHGPLPFTAPVYGRATQLAPAPDVSPPLDASKRLWLQSLVGAFLYYARAIDLTMLVGVGRLAAAQSRATTLTEQDAQHFLRYAATWPNATLRYKASAMCLRIHSDASFHSEPGARSRAGGYFYLGETDRESLPPNGAVHVLCQIFDVVHSSAMEAEYAACFHNGQEAMPLRQTLVELGFPQGATPIQVDNQCAAGLANDTLTQRRSKAIDTRYHWTRDRVRQDQLVITWRRGTANLADFFTKIHPAAYHRAQRRLFVSDPVQSILAANACVRHWFKKSLHGK